MIKYHAWFFEIILGLNIFCDPPENILRTGAQSIYLWRIFIGNEIYDFFYSIMLRENVVWKFESCLIYPEEICILDKRHECFFLKF